MTEPEIHALILTLDEEKHIARCIESLGRACKSITIIDSGSKDSTVAVAKRLGARVFVNPWVNYATQMNFAIDSVVGQGGWLLRIDADEVLDADSLETLGEATRKAPQGIDGLLVQRRIYFLGRRIRYGTIEPSWQLRLWRNGRGRCEQRWMDEHIEVEGAVARTRIVISDINLNSLSWWTAKHNTYASREAIDVLRTRHSLFGARKATAGGDSGSQASFRRFMKVKIYAIVPPGPRALLYFFYRYVLRLGFLDGIQGYYFHMLQGLWYRTLVDAKISEIEKHAAVHSMSIVEAIRDRTGIDPAAMKEL